jgi:uncharacterized protein with von Willebrand factor type A (vWA) domain
MASAPPRPASAAPRAKTAVNSQPLVHAQGVRHLAVLGRRAHEDAPARAREREMQEAEDHRPHGDEQKLVFREALAQDRHGVIESGSAWAEQVLGPKGPQRRIAHDEHQRERREQLEQLGRAVEPAQQQRLDHAPSRPTAAAAIRHGGPEADNLRERHGEVHAQHVQGPVREVDDPADPEDQRQAGGDQEERGGAPQAIQEMDEERSRSH